MRARHYAETMSKAKRGPRKKSNVDPADVPVVGPREPCPCGSGKKYRVCHGRQAAEAARRLVARPFEGLAGECDMIAMREMVPAATAPLTFTDEWAERVGDRRVVLTTLLPLAWPGLVRADGSVLVALQTPGDSGDASRDVADVIERALEATQSGPILTPDLPTQGPRLQDMLDCSAQLAVTVHQGFDYWLEDTEAVTDEVRASMDRANASVVPTERLPVVEAAYWARIGEKEHLRWVLPYDEERALDAFARLRVAGGEGLGEGSRFVGSFRAHGLLVPVWDLAPGTSADDVLEDAIAYRDRLDAALAEGTPLTREERNARAGLLNRQLTLR